ncbi:MAG: hypothetical protein U0R44_05630 [Candidatus Micrarchaeia archaeon]
MKLRFGQPNDMQCGQKTYRHVPDGVPAPWIIEQIKKRKPMVDDRPQPRVEIDDMPPPGYRPESPPAEAPQRGVVVIEL